MTKEELDKYKGLEFAVEKLVDYCNNTVGMATACEVIAVEAALERLYKARQPESERNIIRLAQDAGAATGTGSILFRLDGSLERFAALLEAKIRADEREACAKECEAEANGRSPSLFDALCDCADAIRARGEK